MKITCHNVSKVFDKTVYALNNLSLEIASGDFVVVMGESGCGKSTLLRVIAGLIPLDGGEILLDGVPSNNVAPQDRDCAMIFQNYSLYPNYSVYDNVAFYLKSKKLTPAQIDKRVRPVIDFLGLTDCANVKPKFLSGGQQQRVSLAKALVRKPRLLLFDEPLSNVDEKARENYLKLIKKTKKYLPDSTFIYVTHNSHEASFLADKIAVMRDGEIIDYASPENLFLTPQHLDTTYMLGGDKISVQEGKVTNGVFFGEEEIALTEYEKASSDFSKDKTYTYVSGFGASGNAFLFDENGKIASGYKKEIKINCVKKGNVLFFNDKKIELTKEQSGCYLGQDGNAVLSLSVDKAHFTPIHGDIEIRGEKVAVYGDKTEYKFGESGYMLINPPSDVFYYSLDDIEVENDKGEKLLIKSTLSDNVCETYSNGAQVKIGKDKIEAVLTESGFGKCYIDRRAVIKTLSKKERNTLTVSEVLGEEKISDKLKCVFVLLPKQDGYYNFIVDRKMNFLKRKKFYLLLDKSKIKFKKD